MNHRLLSLAITYVLATSIGLSTTFSFASNNEEGQQNNKESPKVDALQKNNSWIVQIDNRKSIDGYIFATLRKTQTNWEIDSFYSKAPDVTKASGLELFATTSDLKYWTNVKNDMVKGCENDKSKYYSVCSSSLADKKTGLAVASIFLASGDGRTPTGYIDTKVTEAVNSIPPDQALAKLEELKVKIRQKQEAEREKKKKEDEAMLQEAAQVKKMRQEARIGAKDWCEQDVQYFNVPGALGPGMQIRQQYKCFTFGIVDEAILRAEGWTIVNKQPKTVGTPPQTVTVYDIGIEKVR